MQPHQCLQQLIVYASYMLSYATLCDKSFASIWLAKVYAVPAGLYGCQVWRSGFLRNGDVFRPNLLLPQAKTCWALDILHASEEL